MDEEKVYEMAMMINNVILTKIEKDNLKSFEETYGFTASLSAQGTKTFLDGIKSSISAETKETSFSSSKVVETLDVKTTKSILLRRIIEQCNIEALREIKKKFNNRLMDLFQSKGV